MKGMRKISRGSDFSGVMAYVVDGELDNPREIKGELIGGNMTGRSHKELAAEFDLSKAIRPDIKRPVWHNSLRLPAGEKVDKETWNRIGDRYMEKMGFSEHHQRCYLFDDDPKGQHIHIPASRIGLDGSIFLGKNENLRSTRIIAELEIEFGLKITKGPPYDESGKKVVMPEKSKAGKKEMEKALRTETEVPRYQLQKLVDQALMYKPTVTQFVERLQASGVDVIPNIASTGKLNGFSFGLNGVYFSGSKLGDTYKYAQLEKRGLTYDKEREGEYLGQLKASAGNAVGRHRDAKNDDGVQPGSADRNSDPKDAGHAIDIRRTPGGADSADHRTDNADLGRAQGRTQRPADERGEPETSADTNSRETDAETSAERRDAETSPEADSGISAGAGAERSDPAGAAMATPGERSNQSHDTGGAGIATGVEVSSAGPITTGDKGTDELLQAAHSGRLKAEREVLSRQKKQHHEDMANAKKRQAALDKPHTNRLSMLASRSMDSTWRAVEMQRFAQSLGAQQFQVVSKPANAKAEVIKKVYSAEDLQNPKVMKELAHQSARNYQITIQPHDSAGLIMLKGLDAQDIKKLEAIGLQPAAVVGFAGKSQAWIATGSQMSADERKALTKRIESMVGVDKAAGSAGRLVGFSGASLTACPGHVAPAAAELLGEIKSEIFEAKASARLAKAIEKEVIVQARDFDDIGGIKSLRKGWLRSRCHVAEAEATFFGGQYDAAQVERGVLEAMARQGVKPGQAYRAVFDDSRVVAGDERHAADAVAQAYTRVALVKEGKDLAGIDVAAESAKRYPQLLERAETRVDSELKAIHERGKAEGIAESARMAKEAEQQRIDKASEAAQKVALERQNSLGLKPR